MKIKRWPILLIVLVLITLAAVPALAETNSYDLTWWTVDSGGAINLTSGSYTLSGTAGQPDTGEFSKGDYDLLSGFWAGIQAYLRNFLPLIIK